MKILHSVVDLGRGGLEHLIQNIVLGQRQNGHEVEVLCLSSGGYTADKLEENGIKVHIAGIKHLSVNSIKILRKIIIESKPDLLHLHTMPPGVFLRIATIGLPIPYIYHVHTMISVAHSFKLYQKIIQRVLQYRQGITIAISEAVKADLVENSGMKDRNIQVISGGVVDIDAIDRKVARKKFSFKSDEIIITCAAHLIKLKNQETLIRAIKTLDSVVLALAGTGEEEENLKKLANELGISSRVRFLGFVDNIDELYAASDIAALASYPREGLSLSMIEALRAGLPAIVSSVGGLPEVVIDKNNGFVVEAKCHVGFRKAIEQLLDDKLRVKMGNAGRKLFDEKYELEKYLRKIDNVYTLLVK